MLREYAKENRQHLTDAEMRLWYFINNKKLSGYKFRRQHVIGEYIVDFYCNEAKVVIEVDGEQHTFNKEYDEKRTAYLEEKGYRVLRFWNNEVYKNIDGVLEIITNAL
jgi:very-short-patch-repair endonuclease